MGLLVGVDTEIIVFNVCNNQKLAFHLVWLRLNDIILNNDERNETSIHRSEPSKH